MAAVRETEEEAGLKAEVLKIDDSFHHIASYNCNDNPKEPKTVAYWLAELTDNSAEIVLSHEHDAFQWCPLDKAVNAVGYVQMTCVFRSAEDFLRSHRL